MYFGPLSKKHSYAKKCDYLRHQRTKDWKITKINMRITEMSPLHLENNLPFQHEMESQSLEHMYKWIELSMATGLSSLHASSQVLLVLPLWAAESIPQMEKATQEKPQSKPKLAWPAGHRWQPGIFWPKPVLGPQKATLNTVPQVKSTKTPSSSLSSHC